MVIELSNFNFETSVFNEVKAIIKQCFTYFFLFAFNIILVLYRIIYLRKLQNINETSLIKSKRGLRLKYETNNMPYPGSLSFRNRRVS